MLGYIDANGGLGPINAATNVTAAGQVFSAKYERPLVLYSDTRPSVAQQVYNTIAPATSSAVVPSLPGAAAGGPVLSAVKGVTASLEQREAMALGSWLLTQWNAAGSDSARREYGAWLINTARLKGVSARAAQNPVTAARLVAPYYARTVRDSTPADWAGNPAAAALRAYAHASIDMGTHWSTPSAAKLDDGWKDVLDGLGIRSLVKAPVPTTARVATENVRAFNSDIAKVDPLWEGALRNWHGLTGFTKRPKDTSAADWKAWLAERTAIIGRVNAATGAYAPLIADLKSPQSMTPAMFSHADSAARLWEDAMNAAPLARAKHPEYWNPIQNDLINLQKYIAGAAGKWPSIWGTKHVPGPVAHPGGTGTTGPHAPPGVSGPVDVSLAKLIVGGPAQPVTGNLGFGLASGGGVPSLPEVAGMFGAGMASGGLVPQLFVPGLSATLQRQLSASAAGELPRTMSDAGATTRVGLHVDQLTINNPRPQATEDSITRSSNRLALLAGRGMV